MLGSSGKGHEYFLKHMLGATESAVRAEETPPELRPRDVAWRERAPDGKLDLLTTIDFRMTSNALFSDVVLPAATWYEKYDLSSTDLHPFVHAFNEAVPPPWENKTDWETFKRVARRFSELAEKHLGVRRDVIAAPLVHDTADEMAQPFGEVRDWRAGECEPVPGKTMPKLIVVERDYPNIAAKWAALGPLVEEAGTQVKGVGWVADEEVAELRAKNGAVRGGLADGRPSLERVEHACEAILALSGTTNGRLATEGFRSLERTTGLELADLSGTRAGDRITFGDARLQPRTVITSPEWSGIEAHGRRYAPFTMNVEREKPWHTLSGRMHFYLDHAWMLELGEGLPTFRPPLRHRAVFGDQSADDGTPELTLKYLTPHSKWSIHSEYQDNLHMLTLFRGGGMLWLSREDAEKLGIRDNDWVEAYNRNGVIACRAAVTHRVPQGVCMMYHAKDRHLNVPLTELEGKRGGTDNSVTRIVMKPTHFIGGYAQLSFGFNYYGPTGSQRDEVIVLRKRQAEVVFE
jgi:nitrate reductase / nitrite oxidoreductase, alpha subunit